MPTTRSRGLSTADLDTLRTAVEAGRKPKVQFTSAAGQVAGQIGQVVRFDDPSADEWVVVRFGRDELPFAPGDLQLPPPKPPRPKATAAAAPKAGAVPAAGTTAGVPASVGGAAPVGAGLPVAAEVPIGAVATAVKTPTSAVAPGAVVAAASTATRPVTATASTPAEAAASAKPAAGRQPVGNRTGGQAPGKAGTPEAAPAGGTGAAKAGGTPTPATPANANAAAAKNRPARKASGKRAPDLTVTLAHHEGHWTVSAARGARVLVKPTSVRAADALRMVGLLESTAVADAVEEIVSAARAEAEEQAERLRQQLAEVEAALADLSDPE